MVPLKNDPLLPVLVRFFVSAPTVVVKQDLPWLFATRSVGPAQRVRGVDGGPRGCPRRHTGLRLALNARIVRELLAARGSPAVAEHDEDRFAENIYQRALSSRERLGGQLLEELSRRLDGAVQLCRNVGPNDWGKLCYWPPGPEPVRTMLDTRITSSPRTPGKSGLISTNWRARHTRSPQPPPPSTSLLPVRLCSSAPY